MQQIHSFYCIQGNSSHNDPGSFFKRNFKDPIYLCVCPHSEAPKGRCWIHGAGVMGGCKSSDLDPLQEHQIKCLTISSPYTSPPPHPCASKHTFISLSCWLGCVVTRCFELLPLWLHTMMDCNLGSHNWPSTDPQNWAALKTKLLFTAPYLGPSSVRAAVQHALFPQQRLRPWGGGKRPGRKSPLHFYQLNELKSSSICKTTK